MTLEETAQLVRRTAKSLGLTLDKIITFDEKRNLDFRSKKSKPDTDEPDQERFVRAELSNGMKLRSIRVFPNATESLVQEQLEWAADQIGLTVYK